MKKLGILTGVALVALGSDLAHAAGSAPKPAVISRPAAPNNYSRATRSRITGIVIHKAEGSNASGWFADARAKASAHYDVHKDGKIYQSVQDQNVAYHAGSSSYNQNTIGIEHAGFTARNDTTDAQYRASARLSAYLCSRYSIGVDRSKIVGHAEVPGPNGRKGGKSGHTDPGAHWDWNKYLNLIRDSGGATGQQTTDGTPADGSPGNTNTGNTNTGNTNTGNTNTGNTNTGNTNTGNTNTGNGTNGSNPTPKILKRGDQGEEVKKAQQKLYDLNCDPGPIDGIFGPLTEAAVRKFQAQAGVKVTGVIDVSTWVALGKKDGIAPGGFDVNSLQNVLQRARQALGAGSPLGAGAPIK